MGEDFNAPITETTTIWEDNQSAIAYSHNALVSEKTKHIGLKWHFLKDHVEQGTIKLRSWKLGVHAVELMFCCVEHGGAAVERWGSPAADERYANPLTNLA
jgi:hypothetical protein